MSKDDFDNIPEDTLDLSGSSRLTDWEFEPSLQLL